MKLKGRYELVVEYELPDGNYTPILNIIDFFLNDNYEAIKTLKEDINNDYLFFDDSSYGILENSAGYLPLVRSIRTLGFIDSNLKIIKHKELLKFLEDMHEEARDLCNNEKEHTREAKLNMILK